MIEIYNEVIRDLLNIKDLSNRKGIRFSSMLNHIKKFLIAIFFLINSINIYQFFKKGIQLHERPGRGFHSN